MFKAIGEFINPNILELDRSESGAAVNVLLLPFRLVWGFVYFMVFSWTTSRSGRAFVFAIPAMAGVTIAIAVVWAVNFKRNKPAELAKQYYNLTSNPQSPIYDTEAALLYAKKTVAAGYEDPQNKYFLGMAYDAEKEYQRAYEVVSSISPLVDVESIEAAEGFSDGHLYLAGYAVDEKKSHFPESEREKIARQHLDLAYKSNPENIFAVLGLASAFRNEAEKLEKTLESIDADSPEAKQIQIQIDENISEALRYLNDSIAFELKTHRQLYATVALIEILQKRGRNAEAERTGRYFINKYQKLAKDNADYLPIWLSIIKTCILIGDYDEGEKFIEKGYQLAQNPEIRQSLAQLSAEIEIERSRTYTDMDNQDEFLARLHSLSKAIAIDFRVPEVYKEVLYFVDGFESADEKDNWLRDSIYNTSRSDNKTRSLDTKILGSLHVIIGFRDIVEGNTTSGGNHLETASQQFSLASYAVNNLIQIYLDEREIEMKKAHELYSVAIGLFPQSPQFYASRGSFLMENQEYKNAVDDLEFAAVRVPEALQIFEKLVECYRELGESEKELESQKKVEQIKTKREADRISTGFSSGKTG